MTSQPLIAGGGALFGLMLVLALIVRPGGIREGNRLLAAALACNLSYLLVLTMMRANRELPWPLLCMLFALSTLAPVFLLGYVRALIRPGFTLNKSDLLHLTPMLLIFLVMLWGVGGLASSNEMLQQARGGWPPNYIALVGIGMYAIQIAYLGRALYELQIHRRSVATQFSYTEKVTLNWLRLLVGLSLILAATGLLIALVRLLPGIELWPRSLYSMTTVLLVYYLIGFIGLSQPALFGSTPGADSNPADEENAADRSGTEETSSADSALPPAVEAHYWQALQAAMQTDRPYLDSKLRIADLAAQLDMPMHHLSQTINRCAQESFSDYINRHRVEAAKIAIRDSKSHMGTIAFDVGFNSESAFYRHFKNFTHQTPRQYRKKIDSQTAS